MKAEAAFSAEVLRIDAAKVTEEIAESLRESVLQTLRRKGVVLGLSGGIDSSVVAALAVRALGKERVFGIFMPESDSSDDSLRLGRELADWLGIESAVEDVGPLLKAAGCYRRRDDAIRLVVPEYRENWKCKIVLPNLLQAERYPIFSIVVQDPDGCQTKKRLTAEAYLGIVAATNFKQRTRKMLEYYHADRLNFAVAGTPNRLEFDQGFFVKNGDGAADVKPIAHLYKSQVYQLAAFLGVPREIQERPSTTDTYSLEQSQEEFYFAVPLRTMDLCLWARNNHVPSAEVGPIVNLSEREVERVYDLIETKRKATRYLHLKPLLVQDVVEISGRV